MTSSEEVRARTITQAIRLLAGLAGLLLVAVILAAAFERAVRPTGHEIAGKAAIKNEAVEMARLIMVELGDHDPWIRSREWIGDGGSLGLPGGKLVRAESAEVRDRKSGEVVFRLIRAYPPDDPERCLYQTSYGKKNGQLHGLIATLYLDPPPKRYDCRWYWYGQEISHTHWKNLSRIEAEREFWGER